jgi:CheY-like chemotaxis protein
MMSEKQYKLLFVDDALIDEPYLSIPFDEAGFLVCRVTTGLEAYELLKNNRYDAVVLDNMMPPGGDEETEWSYKETTRGLHTGLTILKKMAEMPYKPATWILTGLADSHVLHYEEKFEFVIKVIKKDYLLSTLADDIKKYLCKKEEKNNE